MKSSKPVCVKLKTVMQNGMRDLLRCRVPAAPVSVVMGVALAAISLTACTSGPDYHRPEALVPPAWHTDHASGLFRPALPGDAALKGHWWEVFDDAVLNQLEQQALLKNQSLAGALARLDAARSQADVVAAGLFPQIGLQAGSSRAKISADRPLAAYSTVNQSTVQNNQQLGFSVSYEVDLAGRVSRVNEGAQAQTEQATADLENTRLVLMAELAADYINLRELDQEIAVIRQSIRLQEKALTYIQNRHDLGVASGLDLAQQKAVLDANRTQLELSTTQRSTYLHALATMTGTPAPGFEIAPVESVMQVPKLPVGLPSDVLQRRPDVASSERAMVVANANVGIAHAAYFPTVLLQSGGGWDSTQLATLFNAPSLLWSLGASMTQTLFDGGKTSAGVRVAEAGYVATVAAYRQSVLVAMQEVTNGMDAAVSLGRAGLRARASVQSATEVLDLANDRYNGGLAPYPDVISAQQALLTNQRQSTQITGQRLLNAVYLIKALGGGWSGLGQS